MFVIKDDERLYLSAWSFNSCRVLGCLAKIVEDNGGEVEPYKHCMATNRNLSPEGEPIRIYGQSWICFVLDDMYYHISLDDNPFFDFHIMKTPVVNGKRRKNVYMKNLSRDWVYDCLFSTTTDADAKEIALQLFNIALQAKTSEVYHDKKRIQVRNTYNNGYHLETVYEPDKWLEAKWRMY